jgi:hypothetical protein
LFNRSSGVFANPPNFLIWLIDKKSNNKIKKLARAQPKSNRYFARYEPYTQPLPTIAQKPQATANATIILGI